MHMPVRSVVSNVFRSRRTQSPSRSVSLSRYFPSNSCYFYGYPSGEASGFLNKVPPAIEELVSARPLVCAGDAITVLAFANPLQPACLDFLRHYNAELFRSKQPIISMPVTLDAAVEGKQRNLRVKQSLKRLVEPGTLVMAQPFLDDDMTYLYQIPPKLTNWLNDKQHMNSYVPAELLPARHGSYPSGQAFAADATKLVVPCVVKVSSSSAGDGVYVCKDRRSLLAAKKVLSAVQSTIIVEQYIEARANYGIQFGIPADAQAPIDIIGINEQLTTDMGEFIGGIIEPGRSYNQLRAVMHQLVKDILPQVRVLGWYGVGCFDVLEDTEGRLFIIDGNFRMTGMTAYFMMVVNQHITSSLVSFSAEFHGSLKQLEKLLGDVPLASDAEKPLRIISLAEHAGVYRFNAALLFHNRQRVGVMARQLLRAGIVSKALEQLAA